MFRSMFVLLLFVSGMAQANSQYDKEACKKSYDSLNQYLTSANGFLWELYTDKVIDYDEFMYGQNENVRHSRYSLSIIRERSYVGTEQECQYAAAEGRKEIKSVMEPYLRKKNATDRRNRPQTETNM